MTTPPDLVICNKAHLCHDDGCLWHNTPHERGPGCESELCPILRDKFGITGTARRCECVPVEKEKTNGEN